MTWTRRPDLHELMDDPSCSPGELRRALRFLAWLHRVSLARRILTRSVRPGRILDVAAGGADVLTHMHRRGVANPAVALDRNPEILKVAGDLSPGVLRVQADCFRLPFGEKTFDTAFCHLLFHHLEPGDCATLLGEMERVAKRVVVFDLARSRWLHGLVWLLTRFSGSRLASHDGPVSVRRSYTVREAGAILREARLEGQVTRHVFWRWSMRVG